jgi:hypothetical protein
VGDTQRQRQQIRRIVGMEAAGTRFEVLVGTLVSQATLAAFPYSLGRVPVPGRGLHRLRIPADQDVPTVLRQLIEHDVEVLEIRQCVAPRPREVAAAQERQETARPDAADPVDGAEAMVLPFRSRASSPTDPRPRGRPTGC